MASSQDNSEGPSQFQTTWKLSHSSICPTLFYSPGHFAVYFKCISFLLKIFTYLFPFSGTGSLLLQAGFSLIAVSRGYCLLRSTGFSLPWLLWLQSTGCGHSGFEQFGLAGSRTQAQWWWCTCLAALRHVWSFWTRNRTRVPCSGRQILNHWTTRRIPPINSLHANLSQNLLGGEPSHSSIKCWYNEIRMPRFWSCACHSWGVNSLHLL